MSNVFKLSLSLTLLYSLFYLINSEDQLVKFLKIMFPFAFVALALQIYVLVNGEQLISIVKPGVTNVHGSYNISGGEDVWIRPIEMAHAMLITFTGSLFLLISKPHNLNRQYLVLVNLISFLVILMSGTRSWVISFCLGYITFFFLAGRKTPKLILNSLGVMVIVLLMIGGIAIINRQVRKDRKSVV